MQGLGITLEDALEFWRLAFSKKVSGDKFQKEYAYNIRHNYGKEGKRTSYTPYSCMQIISNAPGSANEHHGCPFRHFSEMSLRSKLLSRNVATAGIDEIIKLVNGQHFQIACQKYFQITHGNLDNPRVNHPNAYVVESMKFYKDEVGLASGTAQGSLKKEGVKTDVSESHLDAMEIELYEKAMEDANMI